MAIIVEKAISILAGNLNSRRSYLIAAVHCIAGALANWISISDNRNLLKIEDPGYIFNFR